jgi:hypothetical protein
MELDALRWLKWSLIVWLNAALSFFLALNSYPHWMDRAAIIAGIFTFVLGYIIVDQHLVNSGRTHLSKALFWGASLKVLTQFFPHIEILTGLLAVAFVRGVFGEITFLSAYLTTILDGLLLSLLVAMITVLLNMLLRKFAAQ